MRSHFKAYHPDAPVDTCYCVCIGRPTDPLCDTCARYVPGPKGPNHFISTPKKCTEGGFYEIRRR